MCIYFYSILRNCFHSFLRVKTFFEAAVWFLYCIHSYVLSSTVMKRHWNLSERFQTGFKMSKIETFGKGFKVVNMKRFRRVWNGFQKLGNWNVSKRFQSSVHETFQKRVDQVSKCTKMKRFKWFQKNFIETFQKRFS